MSEVLPRIDGVRVAGLPRELLGGQGFIESPRWADGLLWYSDFSSRWVSTVDSAGRRVERCYVAGQPSGIGFTPEGDLLIASMYDGRILRSGRDGTLASIADAGGLHRGCLGDMAVSREGRIYISTLPDLTAHDSDAVPICPILMVDLDGSIRVAAANLRIPNGLAITPDGSGLIVAETQGCRLLRFPMAADGSLKSPTVFANLGDRKPDGICLDPSGAVWVCSPFTSEVLLVSPYGEPRLAFTTPRSWAVACAIGGATASRLFVLTAQVTLDDFRRGGGTGAVIMVDLERA